MIPPLYFFFKKYIALPGALFLTIFFATQPFGQTAVTDRANQAYKNASANFYRLYDDSSFKKYNSNWTKTIKQFHDIYLNYPYTTRAIQSLYNIGKLYRSLYKWNRKPNYIDRSNKNFTLLANRYKTSYLADDALYEIGLNYEDILKDKKTAAKYYKTLLSEYPNSEYTESAQNRLNATQAKNAPAASPPVKPVEPKKIKPITKSDIRRQKTTVKSNSETGAKKSLVKRIDRWTTTDWSRVVIVVDKPVMYKYNTLIIGKDTPRFYVDILNSSLSDGMANKIVTNDGIIKQLRIAQFDKKTVRVVLDLENYSDIKIFTFEFSDNFKIVLDVLSIAGNKAKTTVGATARNTKKHPAPPPVPLPAIPKDSKLSLQKILGLKVDRIIIDPGHGGRDPGAKNGRYLEKTITLKLALALRKILEQKMERVEVLLTRERDIYIPLEARTAFANKNKGAMFISLHVNSHKNKKVRGIETYFLNLTDDKNALQLAAVENKSSIKNVSDLQSILNDLMINNKLKESHALGTEVNNGMFSYIMKSTRARFKNRGVRQAPFVVLLGANMPSVLVEIGFISNTTDLKNLRSNRYLEKTAYGIYRGINSYIKKYTQ